jgi:hypothetical protein
VLSHPLFFGLLTCAIFKHTEAGNNKARVASLLQVLDEGGGGETPPPQLPSGNAATAGTV